MKPLSGMESISHEGLAAALVHLVERPDVRDAIVDVALWRARWQRRIRQPLFSDARWKDRPYARLRPPLGGLQRLRGVLDRAAELARLAAPHRRCSAHR